MLSIKEPVFRYAEDSVRSIVPTRLSVYSDDAASVQSFESDDLVYTPFSFENDLFTSYVYKRNFRVAQIPAQRANKTPTVRRPPRVIAASAATKKDSIPDSVPEQSNRTCVRTSSIRSASLKSVPMTQDTEDNESFTTARGNISIAKDRFSDTGDALGSRDLTASRPERINSFAWEDETLTPLVWTHYWLTVSRVLQTMNCFSLCNLLQRMHCAISYAESPNSGNGKYDLCPLHEALAR